MLWNMHVISSKGIPADVTGGDDVATRKYKSTCGEGGGSFLLFSTFTFTFIFMHLADDFIQSDLQWIQVIHFFVSTFVPWESNVCTSYLLLFVPIYSWQLASKINLTSSISDCVPLPTLVHHGWWYTLCVACLGAGHARSALEGANCPHCVRMSMLPESGAMLNACSLRRAHSPVLLAVPVPLLLRQSGGLKSWGSQVDLTEIFETGISDRLRLNGPDDYGPGQLGADPRRAVHTSEYGARLYQCPQEIVPLPLPPSVLQGTAIFSESFSQLPPGNVAALRGSLPLKICLKTAKSAISYLFGICFRHRTSISEHPRGQSSRDCLLHICNRQMNRDLVRLCSTWYFPPWWARAGSGNGTRSRDSLEEGGHRGGPSSRHRVRVLQPLLHRSKEGWRSASNFDLRRLNAQSWDSSSGCLLSSKSYPKSGPRTGLWR